MLTNTPQPVSSAATANSSANPNSIRHNRLSITSPRRVISPCGAIVPQGRSVARKWPVAGLCGSGYTVTVHGFTEER
jgi:hypothetical protein